MKKHHLNLLLSSFLLVSVAWRWKSDPYSRHFKQSLPSGTTLLHYKKHHAGYSDFSYGFVFECNDVQLLKRLVKDWSLTLVPSPDFDGPTTSFIAISDRPDWWLSPHYLKAIPIQYEWVDRNAERYRSLWYDKANKLLYVEYGNW